MPMESTGPQWALRSRNQSYSPHPYLMWWNEILPIDFVKAVEWGQSTQKPEVVCESKDICFRRLKVIFSLQDTAPPKELHKIWGIWFDNGFPPVLIYSWANLTLTNTRLAIFNLASAMRPELNAWPAFLVKTAIEKNGAIGQDEIWVNRLS